MQIVQKVARASRRWASAYSCWQKKAEAMASWMRRQLMRTKAPILSSRRRIVPQVAAANWVCWRPIRRKAQSRT